MIPFAQPASGQEYINPLNSGHDNPQMPPKPAKKKANLYQPLLQDVIPRDIETSMPQDKGQSPEDVLKHFTSDFDHFSERCTRRISNLLPGRNSRTLSILGNKRQSNIGTIYHKVPP